MLSANALEVDDMIKISYTDYHYQYVKGCLKMLCVFFFFDIFAANFSGLH